MAGELEELRLVVTIDDQATAQLANLRTQLSQVGTGQQAAGMERTRRQTTEMAVGFRGLREELSSFATRAGLIGGVVGALTSKLLELGSQFVGKATDVKGYSDALLEMNVSANRASMSTAQLRANIEHFRISGGVGEAAAKRQIEALQQKTTEVEIPGSRAQRELFQGLRTPQEVADMQRMLRDILQAHPADRPGVILEQARQMEEYQKQAAIRRGETEESARRIGAEAMRRYLGFWGAPDLDRVKTAFPRATPEAEEVEKRRFEQSEKFREASETLSTNFGKASDNVTAFALALTPLPDLMRQLADWSTKFLKSQQKQAEVAGKMQEAAEKAEAEAPPDEGFLARFVRRNKAAEKVRIQLENENRVKMGLTPLPVPDEERKPSQREIDAAKKREEFRKREEEAEAAKQPKPTVFRGQTAPVTRPPGAALTSVPVVPGEVPLPVPEAAPPPPETSAERRRRAAKPTPSITDILLGRSVEPAPEAPKLATPETKPPPIIVEPPPAPPPIVVPVAPGEALPLEAPAPVPGKQSELKVPPRFEAAEYSPQMPVGTVPTSWRVEEPRGRKQPELEDTTAPSPSAFEGDMGHPIGAQIDQGQVSSVMDGRALDRDANREVTVNGSGKLSVDVRAPAGTRVSAEGAGLFKSTEITRQTQMLPAEGGPAPVTGAGAGSAV